MTGERYGIRYRGQIIRSGFNSPQEAAEALSEMYARAKVRLQAGEDAEKRGDGYELDSCGQRVMTKETADRGKKTAAYRKFVETVESS